MFSLFSCFRRSVSTENTDDFIGKSEESRVESEDLRFNNEESRVKSDNELTVKMS
jgi:hypothetical protein